MRCATVQRVLVANGLSLVVGALRQNLNASQAGVARLCRLTGTGTGSLVMQWVCCATGMIQRDVAAGEGCATEMQPSPRASGALNSPRLGPQGRCRQQAGPGDPGPSWVRFTSMFLRESPEAAGTWAGQANVAEASDVCQRGASEGQSRSGTRESMAALRATGTAPTGQPAAG